MSGVNLLDDGLNPQLFVAVDLVVGHDPVLQDFIFEQAISCCHLLQS